jgi:hypothetical protein
MSLYSDLQADAELSNCFVSSSTHWTMFSFSFAWMNDSRKKEVDSLAESKVMSSEAEERSLNVVGMKPTICHMKLE